MSRTKNVLRNTGWGFIQKTISLAMPFATRTALIKVLGTDYLGLSSLFTSVLSILNLAELGVSSAIISSMYKPIAEGDTDLICALMQFYKKTYHIIGIVVACVGLILYPFIPQLIKGDVPPDVNIYVLYSVYLANNVISYFLFAYKNCLFLAHQRNDINSKIGMVIFTAQSIIQIILICIFRNYYCYVIVLPICSIISNITTAYFAKKTYPEYMCKGQLPDDIKRDLKKRVLGLMLGRISGTIRGSIDSIFISMFLGLTMVAIYSNYFYVVTAVVGIIQILETSLVAGVGDSLAVDSVEKNHNDFLKFTFILQWIVGWCAICILCLEQPFMELWVGKAYLLKNQMVVLCSIYLFVYCICLIRSVYTQALGMWWQTRYLSMVDIFVNTLLNYYLGKYFGPYGILGATILDIVIVSIPWTTYYLFRDYFGLKHYFHYLWLYLKYFIIMALVGCITWKICSYVLVSSAILQLLLRFLICAIVPNLIYFAIFHKNVYFKQIQIYATRLIKSKMSLGK